MNNKPIFFILGCVRSGTTLLREILKSHPNLICPEETHAFRWSEPFNSTDYNHVNKVSETLIAHRKMDQVNETEFAAILENSNDRKDFMLSYMELFKKAQNNSQARCFDKSPQNVYGLPLIKAYFPDAQIVHIVRNPLNVIASIMRGRGILQQTLTGAINYWKESILIINTLKPILTTNLYELTYEDLTKETQMQMSQILDFLDEIDIDISHFLPHITSAKDNYHDVLNMSQIDRVKNELGDFMHLYGYQ